MSDLVEHIVSCQSLCAEAPMCRDEAGSVYWVDTQDKYCYSMDLQTKALKTYTVESSFQSLGKRKNKGWITQTGTNVFLVDMGLNIEKNLGRVFEDDSCLSFNDGTVGPDGCYYIGFFDHDVLTNKTGGLYRVDHDYNIEKIMEGYALPNGLAFSPGGKKFYFTEMYENTIWEFDFDVDTGEFTNKKALIRVPDEGKGVRPDGLIVDAEGYLWSAQWQGFKVVRYTPEGENVLEVPVPAPTATCMAFIPDNKLFITTAKLGCSAEQLQQYPFTGDCFAFETEIKGLPDYYFEG